MTAELLTRLAALDTPTVCNAIEVAQGQRGFDAFTRGTLVATAPEAIVGYARTAKIAGAAPPEEPGEVTRTRRMAYYRAMADGACPAVVVIEDTDATPVGAFWGEINAAVHKGLGHAGVLTNGLVRDLGDLPERFPILAGGIGPSHGFVHVTEIGGPVSVFGLTVQDGDLVHADRHGAVVIPADCVPLLDQAIDTLLANEALILGPARAPEFDIEKLEAAWAAFEAART